MIRFLFLIFCYKYNLWFFYIKIPYFLARLHVKKASVVHKFLLLNFKFRAEGLFYGEKATLCRWESGGSCKLDVFKREYKFLYFSKIIYLNPFND